MSDFLDKAMTAHNAWKTRLQDAIEGGAVPDEAVVRADDRCDLGKWIHGEGGQYGSLTEFQETREAHARFHLAAAEVIKMIKGGKRAEASQDLEHGVFSKASNAVMMAIMKLKKHRVG